jgi:hypothetical protein
MDLEWGSNPDDQLHQKAISLSREITGHRLTTEPRSRLAHSAGHTYPGLGSGVWQCQTQQPKVHRI